MLWTVPSARIETLWTPTLLHRWLSGAGPTLPISSSQYLSLSDFQLFPLVALQPTHPHWPLKESIPPGFLVAETSRGRDRILPELQGAGTTAVTRTPGGPMQVYLREHESAESQCHAGD